MRQAYQATGALADLKSMTVGKKLLKVALKVCKQRTRDLDELIDDPNGFEALVNDNDWKILGADEMNEDELAQKKHTEWIKRQDKLLQMAAAG